MGRGGNKWWYIPYIAIFFFPLLNILPSLVAAQEGQNDAGSGTDAGNYCQDSIFIAPGSYSGYLDSNDTKDYYNFSVIAGQKIRITMTPPSTADYDLHLYNPWDVPPTQCTTAVNGSSNFGNGTSEEVIHTADSTGYWFFEVDRYSGSGTYNFTLNVTYQTVTVSGWLFYLDNSSISQPIKYALVKLLDWDNETDSDLLNTTYTDGDGFYKFLSLQNRDTDVDNGPLDLYVTVWAENSSVVRVVHSPVMSVHNFSSTKFTDIPSGNRTINATVNDSTRGAFNIFNATIQGYLYVRQQNNTQPPPNVTIKWYPGYSLGSEYLEGMWININDLQADQWDRDAVLHEYGHFILYTYYGNKTIPVSILSGCGSHQPNESTSLPCAYREGWPTFFQAAIKNNGTYTDRYPNGSVALSWDLELQDNHKKTGKDEGTVSNILWDIYDSNNDSNDTVSLGFEPIWDVTKNYLVNTTETGYIENIYQFYDGWINRSHGYQSEVQAIYVHHGLNTSKPEVDKGNIEILLEPLLGLWVAYIEWTNAVFNIDRVFNFYVRVASNDTGWIDVGLNTSYTFYNLSEGNHTFYLMVVDANGTNTTYSVNFTVNASYVPDADVLVFSPHGAYARVNGSLYADIFLVNRDTVSVDETLRIIVKNDRGRSSRPSGSGSSSRPGTSRGSSTSTRSQGTPSRASG